MGAAVQTRLLADDHILIEVSGAVEGECLNSFREALATTLVRRRPARLLIDLRRVTRLDALAVGALAAAGEAATDLGIELTINHPVDAIDEAA